MRITSAILPFLLASLQACSSSSSSAPPFPEDIAISNMRNEPVGSYTVITKPHPFLTQGSSDLLSIILKKGETNNTEAFNKAGQKGSLKTSSFQVIDAQVDDGKMRVFYESSKQSIRIGTGCKKVEYQTLEGNENLSAQLLSLDAHPQKVNGDVGCTVGFESKPTGWNLTMKERAYSEFIPAFVPK